MPAPKVSIIVPVYNTERYLAECLDSALGQTMGDLELICVDDGSTDGSPAILSAYAARDPRVRVIGKPNGGLSSARNLGLGAARGEYILFLDSDDCLELHALATLCPVATSERLDDLFFTASSFFESEELAVRYGSYKTYYQRKGTYPEMLSGRELYLQMESKGDFRPAVWMQLLRRDFLREAGITFIEGIVHEDNPFTLECYALAERARYVDEALYRRRVRSNSIMTEPFDFRHSYGYFAGARVVEAFALAHSLQEDEDYWHQLMRRLGILYTSAAQSLDGLAAGEVLVSAYKLEASECVDYLHLVYSRFVDRERGRKTQARYEREADRRVGAVLAPPSLASAVTARLDIKNAGEDSNDVAIDTGSYVGTLVQRPSWFDGGGHGYVVSSAAGRLALRLTCVGEGALQLALRGVDSRDDDGRFIPVWVDYTSLRVNGKELLDAPVAVWHSRSYKLERPVADGEVVEVSLAWRPHAEAERDAAREELATARERAKGLNGRLASVQKELAGAKGELSGVRAQLAESKGQLKEARARVRVLSRPSGLGALATARLDVKNAGGAGAALELVEISDPAAVVSTPAWLCTEGAGFQIQSEEGSLEFRLRCVGAGELQLALRGVDRRDVDGGRVPVWVDYTAASVNGRELLEAPRAVWHDAPVKHAVPVADGDEVVVRAAWRLHAQGELEQTEAELEQSRAALARTKRRLRAERRAHGEAQGEAERLAAELEEARAEAERLRAQQTARRKEQAARGPARAEPRRARAPARVVELEDRPRRHVAPAQAQAPAAERLNAPWILSRGSIGA